MKKIVFFLLGMFLISYTYGQTAPAAYWVQFTDKNYNPFNLTRPLEFLSQRALDRRTKQGITLAENDLPVSPSYLDSLQNMGTRVMFTSKWQNAATVFSADTNFIADALKISVVKNVIRILPPGIGTLQTSQNMLLATSSYSQTDYGPSFDQINIHHGEVLHQEGYQGQGMIIGLLDAGFYHVDSLVVFQKLRSRNGILAVHNFISGNDSVYLLDAHGMMVLSIMAGNLPGKLIGTAPEADYILYRTENANSEFVAEEAAWAAGMEALDSAGVDVVNSSLGYTQFDDPTQNHTYVDMDGHTTICSKEASLCASKGIILSSSAGNNGTKTWYYISAPSDAENILTIGAVGHDHVLAGYSSRGPTYDGRIKPDVMGIGYQTTVAATVDGQVLGGNGTSFSSPAVAGLVTCLWQEFPDKTSYEIMDAVKRSSDRYTHPDDDFGYGIPDFSLAQQILQVTGHEPDFLNDLYPNPYSDNFTIAFYTGQAQQAEVYMENALGQLIWSRQVQSQVNNFTVLNIQNEASLAHGLYFICVKTNNATLVKKLVKG